MSSASSGSGSTSGKTPTSAPRTPGSEADYLAREADEAKKAAQQAMRELASAVAQGADPRAWLQQRPWLTMGAAAAAGFVAAYGLIPTQKDAALKRIEEIEHAIAKGYRRAAKEEEDNGKPREEQTGSRILRILVRQGFSLLKPALVSALTATVAQKKQEEDKGNDEVRMTNDESNPNDQ